MKKIKTHDPLAILSLSYSTTCKIDRKDIFQKKTMEAETSVWNNKVRISTFKLSNLNLKIRMNRKFQVEQNINVRLLFRKLVLSFIVNKNYNEVDQQKKYLQPIYYTIQT